jgi:hypothetical protein
MSVLRTSRSAVLDDHGLEPPAKPARPLPGCVSGPATARPSLVLVQHKASARAAQAGRRAARDVVHVPGSLAESGSAGEERVFAGSGERSGAPDAAAALEQLSERSACTTCIL